MGGPLSKAMPVPGDAYTADIEAVARQLIELRRAGRLSEARQIVLHIAPDDGRIKKIHLEKKAEILMVSPDN